MPLAEQVGKAGSHYLHRRWGGVLPGIGQLQIIQGLHFKAKKIPSKRGGKVKRSPEPNKKKADSRKKRNRMKERREKGGVLFERDKYRWIWRTRDGRE